MHLDWSIPIGSVLLWIGQSACMLLIAFFGVQRAIDKKFAEFDLKLAGFDLILTAFRGDISSDIRSLTGRVTTLETGQGEWTKTLRQRTHDQADQLQAVILRVDRLERPTK